MPPAGKHRVDVHRVDNAGQPIAGSRIRGGTLRQQNHHGGLACELLALIHRLIPVSREGDSGRRRM
jgi:hypothetical protein